MTGRRPRGRTYRGPGTCVDVTLADGTRCKVRGVAGVDQLTSADLHQLDTFAAALRRLAAGEDPATVNRDLYDDTDDREAGPCSPG